MSESESTRRARPKFPPFDGPNFTQVPDAVFDLLLPDLTGAELKVLLYIIRRTFGFKREADNISLSQMLNGIHRRDGTVLDRGVGLSKKSLLQALRDLEGMNLILRERRSSEQAGNQPTNYRLHVAGQTLGVESTPPLGEKVHQGGGGESTPSPRGKNYPTQETVQQHTGIQDTVLQYTDRLSNSFEYGANSQGPPTKSSSKMSRLRENSQAALAASSKREGFTTVGQVLQVRDPLTRPISKAGPTSPEKGPQTARNPRSGNKSRPSTEGPSKRPTGRPPKVTPWIEQVVSDLSIEFHDGDHVRQNLGQAARLWKASGRSEAAFCQLAGEARSITKQYAVHKPAQGEAGEWGFRNRMPYFFSVLRDLLGMKEAVEDTG